MSDVPGAEEAETAFPGSSLNSTESVPGTGQQWEDTTRHNKVDRSVRSVVVAAELGGWWCSLARLFFGPDSKGRLQGDPIIIIKPFTNLTFAAADALAKVMPVQ